MISNETLLKIQEKLKKDPELKARFTTVLKEIASGIDTVSDEELESICAGFRGGPTHMNQDRDSEQKNC